MDNLGDWIYIIVLIIAGISGLFSSGKKKKKPTDVLGQPGYDEPEERPVNEKSFWDLFEEELEKPKPQPTTVTPVPTTRKQEKKSVVKPQITSKKEGFRYPTDVAFKTNINSNDPILAEDSENENYMFGDESFRDLTELRKAIIYKEILDRKY